MLPGVSQQRVAREAGEFGGSSCVGDLGVARAISGIDVHVGDASPLQLLPFRIGVPG
jgi:hypothetical protein